MCSVWIFGGFHYKPHVGSLKRSRSREGFSLIELMTVVGILSILTTVAIPAFTSYRHQALSSEAILNLNDLVGREVEWSLKHQSDTIDLGMLVTTVTPPGALVTIPAWFHPYRNLAEYASLSPSFWNRADGTQPHPNFTELGFSPAGSLHYSYGVLTTHLLMSGMTVTGAGAYAVGDLDENGLFGFFSRQITLDPEVRIRADPLVNLNNNI